MNRRELLTKGAALAGAVCLPKIVLGDDVFRPQNFHPPTCQEYGLQGTWPECTPPWLKVNTSLVSTTATVHWQVFHNLQKRQVSQTDLTNFRDYLNQTSTHLQGIQLTEPIRTQVYNMPEYLQPPNL